MTSEQIPETVTVDVRWSASLLNAYTIALMVAAPFWAAYMVMQGKGIGLVLLGLLLFGMISLSVLTKPLFSYDPERREFISPDRQVLSLDQIDSIEMDAHDIYFIPKSHSHDGWHLSQRCWVLAPRRTLKALAAQHGWPLKDIAHPLSRFGFWLVP
ncbi:hypothetical protein [Asticcacaulis sp. AND118]|uniref:hypothetical protein n=1 Tax=Asticcacaulis sp. AND118 TaxID=2840468 RepID=UPI001CFF8989|nr:hypothetical protein [Asticcacaulis sp. AND118]UDF03639.1 hypothetical protein LH365_00945 [Asticcacaulis sp. AND118]